jgi:hypothetical protein
MYTGPSPASRTPDMVPVPSDRIRMVSEMTRTAKNSLSARAEGFVAGEGEGGEYHEVRV